MAKAPVMLGAHKTIRPGGLVPHRPTTFMQRPVKRQIILAAVEVLARLAKGRKDG